MTNPMRPMAGIIAPPNRDKWPTITRPMSGMVAAPRKDDNPLTRRPMAGMISSPKTDVFEGDCKKTAIPEDKKAMLKKLVLGGLGLAAVVALGSKIFKKC